MQNLKIIEQKKQDGSSYYYTNLYRKDLETGNYKYRKLYVNFKRGNEQIGYLTIKRSQLSFDPIEREKDVVLVETGEKVKAKVQETLHKLFIFEWEKTEENKQKDAEWIAQGKSFVKEYKERKTTTATTQQNVQQNENTTNNDNEIDNEEYEVLDINDVDLPF